MTEIKEFKNWTKQELSVFCKDKTIDEIASYFGKSLGSMTNALQYRCINYKRIHRKKAIYSDKKEMIKVLAKTFAYENIGRVFGISRQRVEQIVNGD